jgi:hypothetical protein
MAGVIDKNNRVASRKKFVDTRIIDTYYLIA